jgi:phage terminase Nu1 subunit (DNA packaging protein)
MTKPTQEQLEALWKKVHSPALKDYRSVSGYTQNGRVNEKLSKLFPNRKKNPHLFEFTEKIISNLGETAAGRTKLKGDLDRNQMAARKDAAHAEKLEMENDIRRGELVEAEEVRRAWVQIGSNIRASLMSLPSRLAKELSAMEEPREIQIKIDEEVRAALISLKE